MHTFKKPLPYLLLGLLLILAACAQGQPEAQPPDIRYGETVCIACNMIISDERFAAGYAHEISPGRYESIPFDDIGDMLEHAANHPEHTITHWYVHDFYSKAWLDATQAHYMFSHTLTTPMGHGAAALADRTAAETLAAEMSGEVLDWAGLRARFDAGELMVHAHAGAAAVHAGAAMPSPAHGHAAGDDDHDDAADATIRILTPADSATVEPTFTIQVATTGFDLSDPGNHWHVDVDGFNIAQVAGADQTTLRGLAAGAHTLRVSMSDAQHRELSHTHEITIRVQAAMSHDHSGAMSGALPVQMQETILGQAEVNGYRLELVSHAPLHTGYNVIMLHLSDAAGAPVNDAEITYQPSMKMVDGMDHAAGVEQPQMEMAGMYHGAVIFPMPSGPDLGSWSLAVAFADPAGVARGETIFDLEVSPAKLSGSFLTADQRRIFLAVVEPIAPPVGAQPFEVFAMERMAAMEWPALEDLKLTIKPWMPTMDHGSPNNIHPIFTGGGHYLGQINFTMPGYWTVTVVASQDDNVLGEVVFEYNIP